MRACFQLDLSKVTAAVCWVTAVVIGTLPRGKADESQAPVALPLVVAPLMIDSLPNAFRLNPRVISGGQPDGERGFAELQKLGVRTVISVDGAKPEIVTARKFGLRYVHLPHGYDGIPSQRAIELAKAVKELSGPIYIHCHHGKHRSPAAAAVACIGAGLMTRDDGLEVLDLAGTSKHYHGLYEVVAKAHCQTGLANVEVDFRSSVEVPALANEMVQIERTFDHLKQIELAGWRTPDAKPELKPAHEALMLREEVTELLRTDEIKSREAPFQQMLGHTRDLAKSLEKELRGSPTPPSLATKTRLSESLSAILQDCQTCHRDYRN